MSDRLTLADILGGGVSVEWHEAVSLVRDVAARVSDAHVIPELNQIEIAPDGRVEITGGDHSGDPIRRLGQMLQALLGHSAPPVQLRLLITQSTAPAPSFGSIRAFDEALAYFERPGRDIVLKALRERAMAAPRADDSASAPTLDILAPLPATEPQKRSDKRSSRNSARHGQKVVVSAAILVALFAGVAWYTSAFWTTRDASAMALKASDTLGDAVVAGLSVVTERVGLGRIVTAESADGDSPAATVSTLAKLPRTQRTATRVDQPAAPTVLVDVDPVPVEAPEGSPSAVLETAVPGDIAEGETVLQPRLPHVLPSNMRPEELCRVDLLVSEEGTVESVRLVGASCTVRESMFLSAAKAWQFQPALQDGVPMRYRKSIWLSAR
jgi:hypothetical protein